MVPRGPTDTQNSRTGRSSARWALRGRARNLTRERRKKIIRLLATGRKRRGLVASRGRPRRLARDNETHAGVREDERGNVDHAPTLRGGARLRNVGLPRQKFCSPVKRRGRGGRESLGHSLSSPWANSQGYEYRLWARFLAVGHHTPQKDILLQYRKWLLHIV